jgi:hypothetical protein
LRAVAITAAASALITPSAAAHDGETEFITEIDGYYVEVTDNIVPDAGLFYTVFLRRLDRGLPVDNASVEIHGAIRHDHRWPDAHGAPRQRLLRAHT